MGLAVGTGIPAYHAFQMCTVHLDQSPLVVSSSKASLSRLFPRLGHSGQAVGEAILRRNPGDDRPLTAAKQREPRASCEPVNIHVTME